MSKSMTAAAVALLAGVATAVAGPVWEFEVNANGSGALPYGGVNNSAGKFKQVYGRFDTNNNHLELRLTFSNQVTDGLWVALNDGPNPKGHAGELALLYFGKDSNTNQLVLSAYAYNGVNGNNSFIDGNGQVGGNQTPDFITSSLINAGLLLDAKIIDLPGGMREVSFKINATSIQNHNPMYPGSTPWTGVAFDDNVGIWLHPTKGSKFTYNSGSGKLTSYSFKDQGWYDANFIPGENVIPAPMAAATGMVGMLGLAASRRRRTID